MRAMFEGVILVFYIVMDQKNGVYSLRGQLIRVQRHLCDISFGLATTWARGDVVVKVTERQPTRGVTSLFEHLNLTHVNRLVFRERVLHSGIVALRPFVQNRNRRSAWVG